MTLQERWFERAQDWQGLFELSSSQDKARVQTIREGIARLPRVLPMSMEVFLEGDIFDELQEEKVLTGSHPSGARYKAAMFAFGGKDTTLIVDILGDKKSRSKVAVDFIIAMLCDPSDKRDPRDADVDELDENLDRLYWRRPQL